MKKDWWKKYDDEAVNFTWEPTYDEVEIKGQNLNEIWIDEVQSYVVNDGSYNPDQDPAKVTVWNEKKKEWKVLPVQGVTFNTNLWETVDDTEWIQDKLQEYVKPPQLQPVAGYDFGDVTAAFSKASEALNNWIHDSFGTPQPQLLMPSTGSDGGEDSQLLRLFPALQYVRYGGPCPVEKCSVGRPRIDPDCGCSMCTNPSEWVQPAWMLMDWIVHFNDSHRWPRTQRDREVGFRAGDPLITSAEGPNIHDWLSEGVEKYGWDLSCTVPVTGEEP